MLHITHTNVIFNVQFLYFQLANVIIHNLTTVQLKPASVKWGKKALLQVSGTFTK